MGSSSFHQPLWFLDSQSKVSSVTVKAGANAEELQIIDVFEVDSRFAGWLTAYLSRELIDQVFDGIDGKRLFHYSLRLDCIVSVVHIELKGPDNSLRVRQIRLLGDRAAPVRSFSAAAFHQRTCESVTLRVFRLLTAQVFFTNIFVYHEIILCFYFIHFPPFSFLCKQVFGRLISDDSDANSTDQPVETDDGESFERMQDNDLKEHMVSFIMHCEIFRNVTQQLRIFHRQKTIGRHPIQW